MTDERDDDERTEYEPTRPERYEMREPTAEDDALEAGYTPLRAVRF